MGTKILKSEHGGYYVATAENRPLTPLISLEEAKQRKKAIDSCQEKTNFLYKNKEASTDQKADTRIAEETPETKLPSYAKILGGKWSNDRVGKAFIIVKP